MNRRSLLRLLGLAPVAAPAALAASAKPDLPPIDYAGLADDVRTRIRGIMDAESYGFRIAVGNPYEGTTMVGVRLRNSYDDLASA